MGVLRDRAAVRWDLDEAFQEAGLTNPFPRGITFADVDFEIEINGHFLVIEGKRDGQVLSRGQAYTMTARWRDGRTCLVIWGDPPHEVTAWQLFNETSRVPDDLAGVHAVIAAWAKWADAAERPEPRISQFLPAWTRAA